MVTPAKLLQRIEALERITPTDTRPHLLFVQAVGESEEDALARALAEQGKRREDFGPMIVIKLARSPNSPTADVIPIHGGAA